MLPNYYFSLVLSNGAATAVSGGSPPFYVIMLKMDVLPVCRDFRMTPAKSSHLLVEGTAMAQEKLGLG